MPITNATSAAHHAFRFHHDYDYKGAVVRALGSKGEDLDSSDVPAKALAKIGDWTDTTYAYRAAFIGHDKVFVHVDDMLAGANMDEGFIAANATGHVVASGSFKTDSNGDMIPGSIKFDKVPTGIDG